MFSRLKSLSRMSAIRLAMSLTMAFLVILLLIWVAVFSITKGRLEVNLEASLADMVDELEQPDIIVDNNPRHGKIYGFIGKDRVFGNIPKEFMDRRGRFQFDRHHDEFEALTKETEEGLYFVARSRHEIEDPIEALQGAFFLSGMLAIAAAIGFGLYFGLRSQRRLDRINATLEQLSQGQLDARVNNPRDRDDIDYLSHNLDQTAEKLQKLVQQTRNLGANIAHDLRTPLARLRAMIESQNNDANESALGELDHISGTFDAIMRIARVEADSSNDNMKALELGHFIAEMNEIFAPVVEDQNRKLIVQNDTPMAITADHALLTQALANLIQNALVYGEGDITIGARKNEIFVQDQGAGVPETEFENIQKPMVRLDHTRQSEGAGLGLALTRAIADRHGAKLSMRHLNPNGFEISIKFTKM